MKIIDLTEDKKNRRTSACASRTGPTTRQQWLPRRLCSNGKRLAGFEKVVTFALAGNGLGGC